MARQSAFQTWRERWLRRGELLTVAAFTSAVATAASGKWIPLGVALGACVVGVYAICAAEAGWWLPGRKAAHKRAEQEWMAYMLPEGGGTSSDATAVVTELRALNRALTELPDRIAALRDPPEKESE